MRAGGSWQDARDAELAAVEGGLYLKIEHEVMGVVDDLKSLRRFALVMMHLKSCVGWLAECPNRRTGADVPSFLYCFLMAVMSSTRSGNPRSA